MVILGVDLRGSQTRPSAVVALDHQLQVAFMDSFGVDAELLQMVLEHRPSLVAIGAPLALPTGLCCLETSCSCKFAYPQRKGRQLELELSRMGISCFFTNKGSIIKNLIYRGVELRVKLTELGFNVIEVYPHASKVILFGDSIPPKNSAGSLAFMRERLSAMVKGLDHQIHNLDRNACDAVLNAYTAFLHSRDATDMLGSPEEGMVVLPKLPR